MKPRPSRCSIPGETESPRLASATPILTRLDRDVLIDVLNNRRTAVPFAADALSYYTNELTRPIRFAFKIPTNRTLTIWARESKNSGLACF